MSACPRNCTCLNPKCLRCRHPHKCSVVLDDDSEVLCRCDNCGRFTVVNNTSNMNSMNDNPADGCSGTAAEDCSRHHHLHHDQVDLDPPADTQNPDWDQTDSLRVPTTSLPQETSTEALDTDTPHTHSVRFSNFGDQINTITRHAFRKLGPTGRYQTYRTPLRAQAANFRNSRKRHAPNSYALIPGRRFFTWPVNNTAPSQLPNQMKGARTRNLNHLPGPGYHNVHFPRCSNHSQRTSVGGPSIEVDRNEQEPLSESMLNQTWRTPEEEPQSEHHCSSNYGDSTWNYSFERNTNLMDCPYGTGSDSSFICRIPRHTNCQQQWSDGVQCSQCATGYMPHCDSCYLTTETQRFECCTTGNLPSPPSFFHENTIYNGDRRNGCSARICEQCLATYQKLQPCCCAAQNQPQLTGLRRRVSSMTR